MMLSLRDNEQGGNRRTAPRGGVSVGDRHAFTSFGLLLVTMQCPRDAPTSNSSPGIGRMCWCWSHSAALNELGFHLWRVGERRSTMMLEEEVRDDVV